MIFDFTPLWIYGQPPNVDFSSITTLARDELLCDKNTRHGSQSFNIQKFKTEKEPGGFLGFAF